MNNTEAIINPEIDKPLKGKYLSMADNEGYVSISAFSSTELLRQSKSVAAFVDGDEGTNPSINFGNDLRIRGNSGNYDTVMIHIEDLDLFVKRIKDYYGES